MSIIFNQQIRNTIVNNFTSYDTAACNDASASSSGSSSYATVTKPIKMEPFIKIQCYTKLKNKNVIKYSKPMLNMNTQL